MSERVSSVEHVKKVFKTAKTLHCGVSELDYEDVTEVLEIITELADQIVSLQARLAAYEVGYDPKVTLAKGRKQVLVKFEDGYAGEPSEFMIVKVNRKGEICDGVERWFPLPDAPKEDE